MKVPATIMTKKYYKGTSKIDLVVNAPPIQMSILGKQEQYNEL